MLTLALIFALLAVCITRTSRAGIRAATTRTGGWGTVGPAARTTTVFALRLLVEVCHLIVQTVVLVAQIVSLAAQWVETAGARGEA
jgi:hypothetical protein